MPKLIVLYPPPADVATFERRYHAEHVPMVVEQALPGLRKFVPAQILATATGDALYHRIAELYFDSMDALQAAMASPGGQLAIANATAISTGGAPIVLIAEDDKPL